MKSIEIKDSIYSVSDEGNVFNRKTGLKLKPKLTKTGYFELGLKINGKMKYQTVHRTVAIHFIPNPENKPFVNHINGIKTDNRVENLEWVTHQENMDHAKATGLIGVGENAGNVNLSDDEAREICKLLENGYRNIEIAEIMDVPTFVVSFIRNGTCWKHISKDFIITGRSRVISVETLQWVKARTEEGLSYRQIMELSNNPKVTKCVVDDVRRGRYKCLNS